MRKFIVPWLDCPCGSNLIEVESEKGDELYLYYGDKAMCLSCGREGVIETDDCCAYVDWDVDN